MADNVIYLNGDKDTKDMMSDAKFFEGYSRWDDDKGRYETWDEAVERVMGMHRSFYKEKMSDELSELMDEAERLYKDKYFLGAQRALQFGGEQLIKHQMRLYNCFAPETRFLTSDGMKAFTDFEEGDITVVKTHTGKWKTAVVKKYGKQSLNKITFSRKSAKKTFYATPNHTWILKDGTRTTDLRVGDKLYSIVDTDFEDFNWDLGSAYWQVESIEDSGRCEDVWCLEVEDDHSFILEGGVVTGNCTSTYADRAEFFGEFFYVLLCGAGAGVSVQKHHIAKLPKIQPRNKTAKIHVIEDSIEGWGTAADVLMSSYFVGGGRRPEYERHRVYFDTSLVREKGAMISGGFKAPGPESLRRALDKIEHLLQGLVLKGITQLSPIHVYDISMHLADAVLAGGVRRSATIFLFSPDDDEMMKAKTGNWFIENPQRGRSNNSAVIVRSTASREQFHNIMQSVREYGEPGFIFTESTEHTYNPCVEIGKYPVYVDDNGDKHSGWQGCNLAEINGAKALTKEEFLLACRGAAILATLQAGYTDFKFVGEITKKIFEREALIGVSITGWMNNPEILLDEKILREGAELVKSVNKRVAKLISIRPAARTTCVKPAGNASVILKTASGVHGEQSPLYIRNVQMNKDSEVAQLIKSINPYMVEESVWSQNKTDYVISFPVIAPKNSIWKKDLYGVNLLEKVKLIQQNWVEYGTDEELCVDPTVRHNVSNTIDVLPHQWDEVEEYLFNNRQHFAGVSLLASTGDKDFAQAPFTAVETEDEIVRKYGRGAVFASGLIVDGVKVFDNLWSAIMIANFGDTEGNQEKADIRADWIRRFIKYAETFFNGDRKKAEYCLKSVYLLHKWAKIQESYTPIDFASQLESKKFIDVDTTAAAACAGPIGCAI